MNHDGGYGGDGNDAESSGWESLFGGGGPSSFLGGGQQSAGGQHSQHYGAASAGGDYGGAGGQPQRHGFEPVRRAQHAGAGAPGPYAVPNANNGAGEEPLGYHDVDPIERYLLGPSGGYHAGGGGGGGAAGGGMQYFAGGDASGYHGSYHGADGGQGHGGHGGHSVSATHTSYRPPHDYHHGRPYGDDPSAGRRPSRGSSRGTTPTTTGTRQRRRPGTATSAT
ncbi:hypothetical protein THAOC_36421, partial [Thalassiosira oceanica]